jgi:hypothetical protein
LTATVAELVRRIKRKTRDADVLMLCRLILRRLKRNADHVRRWRKTHVASWRGPDREAYLAKQREYMRKYYRKRKRQAQERS